MPNQSMTLAERIEFERVRAAEAAVIASIPQDLKDHMKRTQEAFVRAGGCKGCGSQVFAVHNIPCSVMDNDPY